MVRFDSPPTVAACPCCSARAAVAGVFNIIFFALPALLRRRGWVVRATAEARPAVAPIQFGLRFGTGVRSSCACARVRMWAVGMQKRELALQVVQRGDVIVSADPTVPVVKQGDMDLYTDVRCAAVGGNGIRASLLVGSA